MRKKILEKSITGKRPQRVIRNHPVILEATRKAAEMLGVSMNMFIWSCVLPKLKKMNLLTKDE